MSPKIERTYNHIERSRSDYKVLKHRHHEKMSATTALELMIP